MEKCGTGSNVHYEPYFPTVEVSRSAVDVEVSDVSLDTSERRVTPGSRLKCSA